MSRWERESNTLETLYDVFDYFDPKNDSGVISSGWTEQSVMCDDDTDDRPDGRRRLEGASQGPSQALVGVLDWVHVSSIAVGTEQNYLVSLRNLNTVISLRRGGDKALLWTLSSSLDARSDFEFESDAAKFYQPHSVEQLPNGNIMLMDDGNDRPGCKDGGVEGLTDEHAYAGCFWGPSGMKLRPSLLRYAGCFSRAVMYKLEWNAAKTHGSAKLVWQFEYPVRLATGGDAANATTAAATRSRARARARGARAAGARAAPRVGAVRDGAQRKPRGRVRARRDDVRRRLGEAAEQRQLPRRPDRGRRLARVEPGVRDARVRGRRRRERGRDDDDPAPDPDEGRRRRRVPHAPVGQYLGREHPGPLRLVRTRGRAARRGNPARFTSMQ